MSPNKKRENRIVPICTRFGPNDISKLCIVLIKLNLNLHDSNGSDLGVSLQQILNFLKLHQKISRGFKFLKLHQQVFLNK